MIVIVLDARVCSGVDLAWLELGRQWSIILLRVFKQRLRRMLRGSESYSNLSANVVWCMKTRY